VALRRAGEAILPCELQAGRPISLDSAIEIALANNDAFHATLAQMGMAQGDFVQAGLLTNPSLSTVLPVGVKQWEWTLLVPIEAFLLRPERLNLAEHERQRVAQQLVQNGLQLVRDVRIAYIGLVLATRQHELAAESLTIRQGIADLTEKRLKEGDIAELEAIQARVDAINAQADVVLMEQGIAVARDQLALLMGVPQWADSLTAIDFPVYELPAESVEEMITEALACRPDLRAAEWAVRSAERRVALAKRAWWRFDGILDYNGRGERGAEAGPGLQLDIPVFNKNQGGVMRACAELEAAKYNRDQLQDQITQQIRLATTQFRQAQVQSTALQTRVLPILNEALSIAQKGFESGGASYLLVLQTTSQYVDAKRRELEQAAAACRADADLDLGRGCRSRITSPVTIHEATPFMGFHSPVGHGVLQGGGDPIREIPSGESRETPG
jgi:cobalt-zinc-cadmium efflux system outer membrane protein